MSFSHFSSLFLLLFSQISHTTPIGLKEVFDSTLKKNELLKIQESNVNIADERVSQGFGQVLPKIALNGTYTRQQDKVALLTPEQYNARLTLTQPIFRGLSDIYAWKALRALERAQESTLTALKATLLFTTADAYYSLLAAKKDLEDIKVLSELTTKRVKEIKDRVRIGRSRKGDMLSAEAQAQTITAELETSEATLAEAKQAFTLTTGVAGETDLEEPADTHTEKIEPLSKFLALIEKSPTLTARKENLFAAEETVAASRGQHFPSLDFQGNYYLYRKGSLQDVTWDVGVTLTFPLFAGGTIQSALQESIENRKIRELELARGTKETTRDVETAYKNWTSLLSQHKAYEAAYKAADENYKQQNKDYKYGLVTNLEVLQAMDQLQQTKRAMNRTFYQSRSAYFKLKSLVGDASL